MMLTEQVFAQSLLLVGELEQHQMELLRTLCSAATTSLAARMRTGLTPEDCKADFIAAASLLALADLSCIGENANVEQISVGDFTVKKGSRDAASNCLRAQAELMIAPYLKDSFSFRGV